MSQNIWATIMPFGPVTNFLLAQHFFFGPAKGCGPHFRHWSQFNLNLTFYSPSWLSRGGFDEQTKPSPISFPPVKYM